MEATTTTVPVTELKKLIFSIAKQELPICIRYRSLGQLWYPNFLRVIDVQESKRILFHDQTRNKIVSLPDLSMIIQFELDGRFNSLEPNCHYQVADSLFFNDQ